LLRINVSPALSGFVTTVVLACTFPVLAAALWLPSPDVTVATGEQRSLTPPIAVPVRAALR
jgi:putative effector of murein hydrolase